MALHVLRIKELKKDPEIVLSAVKQNGTAVRVRGAEIEIVLSAVKQNGFALQYASEELKKDRDRADAEARWLCTYYASEELKKDPEIVLSAVKQMALHCSTRQRS